MITFSHIEGIKTLHGKKINLLFVFSLFWKLI